MKNVEGFLVVDSMRYARTNCFISQLVDSLLLQSKGRHKLIELNQLHSLARARLRLKEHKVLFLVRQRIMNKYLEEISMLMRDQTVDVYDQDPWNSYLVDSTSYGFYERAKQNLQIGRLFLTSRWWSEYVFEREAIKTSFVKMWMSPNLCSEGREFSKRKIEIGFRGTLRHHRRDFFSNLGSMGLKVQIETKSLSYKKYLKYLSGLQVFIHDESANFVCDFGEVPMSNGMWIKDVETAARGTFVLRDANPESKSYDIDRIPLIRTYSSIEEVPEILSFIKNMGESESKKIRKQSVEYIIQANYWKKTAEEMLHQ